jgi:DNA-binding NtrC family response regulator
LTEMNERSARSDQSWISFASRLLPVPGSPVISTLASERATWRASFTTSCIGLELATSCVSPVPRRIAFSSSSRRPRRRASASFTWLRSTESRRWLFQGFSRKSLAPTCIAFTATSTLAQAVITITGEPGTGKSLLAKLIHDWSDRAERSFISVNAGGLPETVFESEMFGHVKGAFTDAKSDRAGRFELADGGTLFLDEIGNVPPAQQARLLRALETGEYERVGSSRTQKADVRVVSATNADLPAMIRDGRFREDLLFRINTVEIRLPPLRERREEILELANAQLARKAAQYGRTVMGFDAAALAALQQYAWPGNVRELNSVVERSLLLATGGEIGAADLRLSAAKAGPPALEDMSLEDAERALIRSAIKRNGGSVQAAAEALGLSRSAMYRRLEKLGLKPDQP